MTLLFSLLISNAHAGWLKSFCESFIAPDPYQFELASDEWLKLEQQRLEIKEQWGALEKDDADILKVIRFELARREARK